MPDRTAGLLAIQHDGGAVDPIELAEVVGGVGPVGVAVAERVEIVGTATSFEDALALVADATASSALEARGDAEVALGRREAAQAAYLQAIEALDADAPQRQLLEIKLVAAGGTPPAADGGDA